MKKKKFFILTTLVLLVMVSIVYTKGHKKVTSDSLKTVENSTTNQVNEMEGGNEPKSEI